LSDSLYEGTRTSAYFPITCGSRLWLNNQWFFKINCPKLPVFFNM